jgi:alkaline phosphatase D
LYVADRDGKPQPTVNLLLHHGVLTCLEYAKSGDLRAALRRSNPDLAPHLKFLDLGGHGYATLRLGDANAECEFVCIPRPLERSATDDGGPLRYRVVHEVRAWQAGERPVLQQRVIEGDVGLAL